MHLLRTSTVLLASLASTTALTNPIKLATTFSSIASELNNLNLGNCPRANAILPLNNTQVQLPPPCPNLTLKYIALGRGTQNYTCASANATSRNTTTPTATGAAATLFDASCLASTSTTLLHELPAAIGRAPLGALAFMAGMLDSTTDSSGVILGEHYFDANGDPFFDLRSSGSDAWMIAKKDASVSAPMRHYSSHASKDVPWLKLGSMTGNGIKVSAWLIG